MKEFETDYIQKVIDIMKENELTEVILEDNNSSLVIKSNGYKPVIKHKEEPVEEAETVVVEEVKEEITAEEPVEKKNIVPVVSNMIGMFYSKPSPDAKPFVQVGDKVKEGQIICIIETIKLVNKITSDVSGTVTEVCIEDGKPVEYGQVIMYVEQD